MAINETTTVVTNSNGFKYGIRGDRAARAQEANKLHRVGDIPTRSLTVLLLECIDEIEEKSRGKDLAKLDRMRAYSLTIHARG